MGVTEMVFSRRFCEPRPAAAVAAALLVVAGMSSGATLARGDAVTPDDPFWNRLSAPLTSVVQGQGWRDALRQVAARADVNLWIDRRVDPTAAVDAGQIGPTVFAALRQLASQRDCDLMPIAGVVLIGPPQWLDATAASIWRAEPSERREEPVTVAWPELTTPTEALQIARGQRATGESDESLPHDLWPAVRLKSIDRRVAVTLVLAQFDLQLQHPGSLASLASTSSDATASFVRRYASGRADKEIRDRVAQIDRDSEVRQVDSALEVTSSPAAHRVATATWLDQTPPAGTPAAEHDPPRFDLRLKNKPAGTVLRQLAATAGKHYRIAPEAEAACQQLVSLQAKNATLGELAQEVAQQVGVQVDWGDESVVVEPAP